MSNYIFGKKAIVEAIENKKKIEKVLSINQQREIADLCHKNKIKYEIVNKHFFNKFSNVNHQNILAILQDEIKYIDVNQLLRENYKRILILDSIQSPQNFGSILRSCFAFKIDVVIFKNKNQCPINDLVIKTAMGATNYLLFCRVSNINQVIDLLKKENWWIYGTAVNNQSIELSEVKFTDKAAIIIGNEENGVSQLTLSKCDFIINIEMNELIDSLNASVAAGIILYKLFKCTHN